MDNEIYAMMKSSLDAHTLGINAAVSLLRDCGYSVIIAPLEVEDALRTIESDNSQKVIVEWIIRKRVTRIGISYRLDPVDAVKLVGKLVYILKRERLYEGENATIQSIHFAGLKQACDYVDEEYGGRIHTFRGGESAEETLQLMGVPKDRIPVRIIEGCKYDNELLSFGKGIILKGDYVYQAPYIRKKYKDYGTNRDTLIQRLINNFEGEFRPLIRAHFGPYLQGKTRQQCLEEYYRWCRSLAKSGYLDILSIGSSQLSQSNFGEDWEGKKNGGGVPINSEKEYEKIWKASQPMLVRTYSGTSNIRELAQMYDRTINMAWHALSLWWFNKLDGRGANSLYDNLVEHIDTIKYIAAKGGVMEANVPHHFAFRGCDDVTYIVSAYISAKLCKENGVKFFVLQNMLNTPRSTWGIQDLAKSRAMIDLINGLKSTDFRVILQTRAGLDYFRPDLEYAKIQLASVTALMDDIEPENQFSPEIIHVVSYSEALFLATPEVIDDSIKIVRTALSRYRSMKTQGLTFDTHSNEIDVRTKRLKRTAKQIIEVIEREIPNLYSPEGLYLAFVAGWLPVPELWSNSEEYRLAKNWQTKLMDGGIELIENNSVLSVDSRINKCMNNFQEAKYIYNHKNDFVV